MAKITDELAVFETNNRRLTEHNEKALVENGKLFGQNEQLVAANSELSVRCDALERELSEKTARLASQLEKEREKERELAEHNANQEKLIKQLQANPSREELEYLQQENMVSLFFTELWRRLEFGFKKFAVKKITALNSARN